MARFSLTIPRGAHETILRQGRSRWFALIKRFGRDEAGVYAVITALSLPVLVGAAAFGTEEGLLLYKHRQMQHAADSSAVSAAVSYAAGTSSISNYANAVAAEYGFVNGANANITISQPPQSGPNKNNARAIEVIISQNQPRLFSSIWDATPVTVTARAVAVTREDVCVLALDRTA